MYKSRLQELCHQKSWNLPEYITTREGPPHNSRFHASVIVNGISFSASAPARSSKLAQNDAASVAFSHFASSPVVSLVNALHHSSERTALQKNALEVCQSSGSSVGAASGSMGGLAGSSVAINELNDSGKTMQNAVERIQTQESGVVAVKNENIPLGSSVAINELNNSGLTMQNADERIQTQKIGVVALKNENISLGSSVVTNISELTTPNALETSQTQGGGVVAVAKNDYSSLGSTSISQLKEPATNPSVGNESVVTAVIDDKYIGSTSQMKQPETKPIVGNERGVALTIENTHIDMHHMYKNQLQSYTQKRNMSFPVYCCEREGPPHACRFRCKVIVDRNTYGSQEFHSTLHKAELAAAKVALMSLSPNGIDQDESGYKNLLQELVQKKGHPLPTYTTSKYGEDHVPVFVSRVEVGGECFVGQEARSKKQAESSAAKIAYTTLKQQPTLPSSRLQAEETTHAPLPLASQSGNLGPGVATQQLVSNKRSDISGNSNENLSCLPPSPKRQEVQLSSSSNRADYIAFLRQHVQPSIPVPEKQAEVYPVLDQSSTSKSISSSSGTSLSSLNESGQSMTTFSSNSSSSSAIYPSIEHLVKASTTCQIGVVVHPRQSSMSYPSGSTVLPCSNNDWMAVKFTPDPSN